MARTAADNSPHPVDLHVGRRVAEKRISLGFSQTDLAQALGLSFQQVQKYEKGANRISASKLWDVAQFLSVEIGYFFAGLSNDPKDPLNGSQGLDHPPTRQSLEITRLGRQLSERQQKLMLDLMTEMSSERR